MNTEQCIVKNTFFYPVIIHRFVTYMSNVNIQYDAYRFVGKSVFSFYLSEYMYYLYYLYYLNIMYFAIRQVFIWEFRINFIVEIWDKMD